MNVLVLGGTRFVGRALAAAALERGWAVTTVSRGHTGSPPDGVTWHHADRHDPAAMQPLAGTDWDLVLDTWSDEPAAVAASAKLLAGCARWYGYVSSRSVYQWPPPLGSDESAPLVEPDHERGYAGNKRGGELAVLEHFGDRSFIARAGLIFGPHEDTGRLIWWLHRAALGGDLVVPAPHDQIWQYVDVRDLANVMLDAGQAGTVGIANVVCPRSDNVTTARLINACIAATGSSATPVWVESAVLKRVDVEEWVDLPGWAYPDGDAAGLHDCDVSTAIAAGLVCRSIEETAAQTWEWLQTLSWRERRDLQAGSARRGLTAEQEQSIWWLLRR